MNVLKIRRLGLIFLSVVFLVSGALAQSPEHQCRNHAKKTGGIDQVI